MKIWLDISCDKLSNYDIFRNIQTGPHSHYAALLEPTSSQPLRPNQTLASEEKAGIVEVEDNSFSVTNHSDGSDLIKTKDDTSLSDDIRETSKVGEILSKFVLKEPLAEQYDRRNIQYHKLYQNTHGKSIFYFIYFSGQMIYLFTR